MLNLFFGLIVNALQRAADKENLVMIQNKSLYSLQDSADRLDSLEAKVDTLLDGIKTLNKRFDI